MKLIAPIILLFSLAMPAGAAADDLFPDIVKLDYTDLNYRQLQEDIEFFHRARGSGRDLPPVLFYRYIPETEGNIFSIAAMAGLTYDTIATFNRIGSAEDDLRGKSLLLPSQPGIFLPAAPETDLEYISLTWRASRLETAVRIKLMDRTWYFFPGDSFHTVERAYFLKILFTNPLPKGVLSSAYGNRTSPFTGHNSFHNGIDLAAPMNTPVYAAREGEITAAGYNSTFGNFIEISHAGGYSTFYGHLNKIFVELHDRVNSTIIIAEVGSTGLSTGPHLHFEVRRNGKTRDPADLTPGLDQ